MSKGPGLFVGRHRHHGHHSHLISNHLIKDIAVTALAIKGLSSIKDDIKDKK